MKRVIFAMLVLASVSACNTVEGMGRDISGAASRAGQLF